MIVNVNALLIVAALENGNEAVGSATSRVKGLEYHLLALSAPPAVRGGAAYALDRWLAARSDG